MKNLFLLSMLIVSLSYAEFTRDSQTGIVTDVSRKMQWQDNNISAEMSWMDAIETCEALSLGGHDDWRLPNINELRTIIDRSQDDPTVSPFFVYVGRNVLFSSYWSSTTDSNNADSAWVAGFWRGEIVRFEKHADMFVRCVRNIRQ